MTTTTPTQDEAPDLVGPLLHMLGHVAVALWWVWAIVAVVGLVKVAWAIRDERRVAASGIEEIDRMDGITFERRMASLFRGHGYSVERTRARGDYGADLVVERAGVRTVVQAKRWTKRVGVKAVQEAVAAKAMYSCTEAMVVTNSTFTEQARTLARANQVALWDRDRLVLELVEAQPDAMPVSPMG
jgi:restriction system protein